MGSDLIPEEESHDWTSGTGLLNDASNLLGDYNDGADAFDWTFDGVSAGLDALITLANPLQAASAAGVGWILENMPGISQLWDMLSGDPEAIQSAALTWLNISTRMYEQGETFATQAAVIEGWSGPAADSFRQVATEFAKIVGGVASDARFLSIVITGVGAVIAALREVVYWAISTWLYDEVLPEAFAALATSWCSFGGSVAAFLTWLIISTSITSAALGEKVGAAGVKVAEVYVKIGELLTKLGQGGDALRFGIKALEGVGEGLDKPWVWGPRGVDRHVENTREGAQDGG